MTATESDLRHLRRAVDIARATMLSGAGRPFGAVLVRDGVVLAEGANTVRRSRDPTEHAEMAAIRSACRALATDTLAGATLYASGEPCPMCLGAIYLAGIGRVFYASSVQEATRIGNLSEAIYAEYRKPAAERSTPCIHVPLPEAAAVFDAWRAQLARVIEPVAVAAWPARETLPLSGWLARFTDGHSHRGNSVVTAGPVSGEDDARIAAAEAAYAQRGLAPMFQLTPLSEPADLGKRLLARGYRSVAPTQVCVADAADVLARLPGRDGAVLCDAAEPRFRRLVAAGSRSPADACERLDILDRLTVPHACVMVADGDLALACGAGMRVGDWVCCAVMRSDAAHRRRGYAGRVLAALAAWAQANGSPRMFLQVEEANAPARALYAKAGFRTAYAYGFYLKG